MPDVRRAVAAARARGECEVLQRGSVVRGDVGEELEGLTGPLRVRAVGEGRAREEG